jgi:Flp pilus assembly pilin Flp
VKSGTRLPALGLGSDAEIMSPAEALAFRSLGDYIMKAISNFVASLVKDEQGGEVLEYALIAGLIVVAAIAVIGSVGGKVLARWNSLNSSM